MEVDPIIRNARNVAELFLGRVAKTPKLIAYEYQDAQDRWHAVTYEEYARLVREAALGLRQFGIHKDSCVAIWGETMPEWTVLDLGTVSLGAHVAGIYQTCTPEQAAYIINDSRATVLCADSFDLGQLGSQGFFAAYLSVEGNRKSVGFVSDSLYEHQTF